MAMIVAESFRGFDLKYDELNQRLNAVKKEFGMRRAISTHSLVGETRTFAEILDSEVEIIVLYYLEVQGILANQLRVLRSRQIKALEDISVTLDTIEELCQRYREIGHEVLELLNYLDRNSIALRKILLRHDMLFDQKMGSLYFDSRLSTQGNSVKNGAQLRQLYRQEGIIAIVASIRRGFEELYDARKTLLDNTEDGFALNFSVDPVTRQRSASSVIPFFGLQSASNDIPVEDRKVVPRVPFKKRLASHGNLQKLVEEISSTTSAGDSALGIAEAAVPDRRGLLIRQSTVGSGSSAPKPLSSQHNHRSTGSLFALLDQYQQNNNSFSTGGGNGDGGYRYPIRRSLSDLEPVLRRIGEVGQRVMKTQEKTTLDFLTGQSEIALEFSIRDINRAERMSQRKLKMLQHLDHLNKKQQQHYKHLTPLQIQQLQQLQETPAGDPASAITPQIKLAHQALSNLAESEEVKTSLTGLWLNLLVTFLYQANQYIVAPTSSQYANRLGMSNAMSGLIIGLSPAAALVSSLLYSKWSNYSFKQPLLLCIICEVVGNLLYGAALQYNSVSMLFLGRLLTGFGGPRVISRRYIADHVSWQDRLVASGQFVSAGALGLVFGPLLASLISKSGLQFTVAFVHYETITAPGWTMAVFWALSLVLVIVCFEEPAVVFSDESSVTVSPLPGESTPTSQLGEGAISAHATSPGLSKVSMVHEVVQPRQLEKWEISEHHGHDLHHSLSFHSSGSGNTGLELLSSRRTPSSSGAYSGISSSSNSSSRSNSQLQAHSTSEERTALLPMATASSSTSSGLFPTQAQYQALQQQQNVIKEQNKKQLSNTDLAGVAEIDAHLQPPSRKMQHPERSYFAASPSHQHYFHQDHYRNGHSLHDHQVYETTGPQAAGWTLSCLWRPFVSGWGLLQRSCCTTSSSTAASTGVSEWFGWLQYITAEVHVILFVYLVNKIGQELTVSSMPLLLRACFNWTDESTGYYMAFVGALVVPTNILVHLVTKEKDERDTLISLTYVAAVAVLLVCHITVHLGGYTLLQYLLGTSLLFTMLNAIEGVVMSLLSKLIAPELARGTFNSGLLATEAGTLGRVVGDCLIAALGNMAATSADPVDSDPASSSSSVLVVDNAATELVDRLYFPLLFLLVVTLVAGYRFYDQLLE